MSSPFDIRTATASDIPVIVELFGILDDLHTAGVPWAFRGSSAVPRSAQSISELIAGPRSTILVAVGDQGQRVLGHVVVEIVSTPEDKLPHVHRTLGLVHDLIVVADQRRRGIGRALVAAGERWVADRGVTSVELTVWAFNDDALRLYETLGYATQQRRLRRVLA